MLGGRIDQLAEAVPREPDVHAEHAGPVQIGRRVVRVGRDDGGPAVARPLLVVAVGVVDRVQIAAGLDEERVRLCGHHLADRLVVHVANTANDGTAMWANSDEDHKNVPASAVLFTEC